jgi:hypothetical protein
MKQLMIVDIATYAAERRRDNKEKVARIVISLRHQSTGKKYGTLDRHSFFRRDILVYDKHHEDHEGLEDTDKREKVMMKMG